MEKQKTNKILSIFLGAVLVMFLVFSCKENTKEKEVVEIDYLKESKEDFNERMKWWRDARFGMFIHWGAYSVPGGIYKGKEIKGIGEWIMHYASIPVEEYEKFAKEFNPIKYEAETWAKIAKDAGMKYMVITSKHHDGFALWDSEVSDYNTVDFSTYGKDILKALSEACKKEGIKFGLYYSILDWHHPDAQSDRYKSNDTVKKSDNTKRFAKYYENYLKPQLKELVENYDPEIIWFDGEWTSEYTHEQGLELYQYLRSLKPSIIINNRVDKGRQGMQGMNKDDSFVGDFGTPEQEILESASALDWESCMTLNDTWGFKKKDHNWKSTEELLHNLVDIAAKGGNYLLNVGPTPEGEIPAPTVGRLAEMGDWLAINGAVIYETEKLNTNYKQGEFIRFTKKKGRSIYYATLFSKPEASFILKNIKPKVDSKIYVLGQERELEWEYLEGKGIRIKMHKETLSLWNENSIAWVLKIEGEEL